MSEKGGACESGKLGKHEKNASKIAGDRETITQANSTTVFGGTHDRVLKMLAID